MSSTELELTQGQGNEVCYRNGSKRSETMLKQKRSETVPFRNISNPFRAHLTPPTNETERNGSKWIPGPAVALVLVADEHSCRRIHHPGDGVGAGNNRREQERGSRVHVRAGHSIQAWLGASSLRVESTPSPESSPGLGAGAARQAQVGAAVEEGSIGRETGDAAGSRQRSAGSRAREFNVNKNSSTLLSWRGLGRHWRPRCR